MTPYGKLAAQLARLRETENSLWLARGGPNGDPRATGQAAREHMEGRFGGQIVIPRSIAKTISRLFGLGKPA